MTLKIITIKQFKKDIKRFLHKKPILKELESVIKKLANEEILDARFKDHLLIGNWAGYRECHIRGDLILVYKIDNEEKALYLATFGSHAEVLRM